VNNIREINRIIPGITMSVIEEFEPGKNTFVVDGEVKSSVIGKPVINMADRVLNVEQKNSPSIPKIGDIVVGYIDMLFGNMISVRVVYINEKYSHSGFSAIASTRIPNTGNNYNSGWRERNKGKLIFKVGDIIRGKVFSLLNSSIHITLDEKDLGLVYTICFSCGNDDLIKTPGGLKCSSCGNFEERKVSNDYGKESFTSLYDKQYYTK
jgi:exosome complex component CSL4